MELFIECQEENGQLAVDAVGAKSQIEFKYHADALYLPAGPIPPSV